MGSIYLFSHRLPPNTYYGSRNLSLVSTDRARQIIFEDLSVFENKEIIFGVDGKFIRTTFSDIGINVDLTSSLIATNNYLFSFKRPLADSPSPLNPIVRKNINIEYGIDFVKFNSFLSTLARDHEVKPTDARIVNSKNGLVVVDEQKGDEIDVGFLVSELKLRLKNASVAPIQIKKLPKEPIVVREGTQNAVNLLKKIGEREIVLSYKGDSWRLTGAEFINLTEIFPKGRKSGYLVLAGTFGSPIVVEDTELSPNYSDLEVSLNEQGVGNYLATISGNINKPRVDATMRFDNGKISNFTPAVEGQKLDIDVTKQQLANVIYSDNEEKTLAIDMPVVVDPAKIANSSVSSLGIKELIASGTSYFRGSIPNRVFNVGLGASRVSGTIVAPGDTFSFNNSVGEVSGTTGYKQAYVISEGRTVLDDGGGICQVSTTVYRAALNAGLPIVSRTAHAYRVSYYEQGGFGAGMDATVWSPSVDFKFKNDTNSHILVQALVEPALSKLQVDIYGTKDDRRVEISKPNLSNIKPAPPDKFQDDPTLPKGTKKQVDFAANGATAVFTRKVYMGDKLVNEETVKSIYRPWQAIFLVGTG